MIAFVLSGGGSRGALEAGALLALFEGGIRPNILVGTSAGALNAGFIATDPTPVGAARLAEIWSTVRRGEIFPPNDVALWLTFAWRFLTGQDGLLSSVKLRRFAQQHLPSDKHRFGDLPVRLYVTAADLNAGDLYLWGEFAEAEILDAMMASAAHPTLFPPLELAGRQLVDGGVVANVPITIAVEKGATEVWVINVGYAGQAQPKTRGALNIGQRALTTLIYQQLLDDIEESQGRAILHHIVIDAFQGLAPWDLSHGPQMVEEGYRVAKEFLGKPAWERVAVPAAPSEVDLTQQIGPPGAIVWRPRRIRAPTGRGS